MNERFGFWLPTKPYSIVDAINRAAAATGSLGYAAAATGADYNGHRIDVSQSAYGTYTASYRWAGLHYITRGVGAAEAMAAAKRAYDRGAKGSSVKATVHTPEDAAAAVTLGYTPWSREIEAAYDATWRDARYNEAHAAIRCERQEGIPATAFLIKAVDLADYRAQCDAFYAERRARRMQRRAK